MWRQLWFIPPHTWDENQSFFLLLGPHRKKAKPGVHDILEEPKASPAQKVSKNIPFDDSLSTVEL
jgi:hypothetical protein